MRLKAIGVWILFLFCVSTLPAQKIDQEILKTMDKAFAYSKAKQYRTALKEFQKISERTKGIRTDRERDVYIKSLRMQILCHRILDEGKQAWECCERLIKLPLSGQVKQEINNIYLETGISYVQDEMLKESRNMTELRDILFRMEAYASPSMQKAIQELSSETWNLEALDHYRKGEIPQSYSCLLEAYDGFAKNKNMKRQNELLVMIRATEKKYAAWIESRYHLDTEEGLMALMQQAVHADSLHQVGEALQSFLIVSKHTREMRTDTKRDIYFLSQIRAVGCYMQMKRYSEAWSLCRDLLALSFTGEKRQEVEYWAVQSGSLYGSSRLVPGYRDYEEARKTFMAIIPYAEGEDYKYVQDMLGTSWYLEGAALVMKMQEKEAEKCYQNALTAFVASANLKQQGETFFQLGNLHRNVGNAKLAAEYWDKAKALAVQVKDSLLLANVRKEQTQLLRQQNEMSSYAEEAWALDSLSGIGQEQKYYLDYGDRMLEQGNYSMAEYYYNRSLYKMSLDKDGAALYILYYSKMRDLKMESGDYAAAADYGRRYLHLESDKNSLSYYMAWLTQGIIYARLKDAKNFASCFDFLMDNIDKKGLDIRAQALIYTTRGLGYSLFQEWQKAYDDFSIAEKNLLTHSGAMDENRLNNLSLRGKALSFLKRYDEALKIYKECADLYRSKYGEKSVLYNDILADLGAVYLLSGDSDKGCRVYAQAVEGFQHVVKSQLRYVSSADRSVFWNTILKKLWPMSSFALQAKATNNSFTEASYNALLFSKSLLLETERSLMTVFQKEGAEEDLKKFKMMLALQNQVASLYQKYGSDSDTLAILNDRIQKLDRELTVRSKAYADYTDFLDVDYRKIKGFLKDKELLVDFVDYVLQDGTKEYAAYLVRGDWEYPVLIRMFTQKEMDALLQGKGPDLLYGTASSGNVLKLLWEKIRPYAAEEATVYYVPSGKMYQVAWESLPMNDGSLLGDHYHFVRLSSAREVSRLYAVDEKPQTAVLYGGLQYDMTSDEMLAESRKYQKTLQFAMRGSLRGDSAFVALPESGEEVRQIAEILNGSRYRVKVNEGISGTEESFVSLSGQSPRILHLATHGFYFIPSEADQYDYLRGFRDAMLLSGLVLSGGNAAWKGEKLPEGVLGGILTAQDISGLDLSGTDLVVLSACQTGQGKVTAEGLYGLQRAFKKAGAQTLVMTLWRVSDRVTREFMVEFYKNLVLKNENKRSAFEKARSEIRSRYPEPFYWAGFIMID